MLRLLAFLALAQTAFAAVAVKLSSGELPPTWELLGSADAAAPYNFTLHLVGRDMAGLSTRMNRIVAAGSGQWLSDEELAKHASPTDAASKAVKDFLQMSGIPSSVIQTSKYGDRVTVMTTVGQTAKIFSAKMETYNSAGPTIIRTRDYTIPATISAYVDDVSPLALFGSVQGSGMMLSKHQEARMRKRQTPQSDVKVPSSCNVSAVTPQCRKDYYGTESYQRSKGNAQADVAVLGFNSQMIDDGLMQVFLEKYGQNAAGYKTPVIAFNGAPADGVAKFEAILNTETVVAEIFPLTTTFLSMTARGDRSDPWLLTFNTVIENYTSADRPKVLSISFTGEERYFSSSQAKVMCDAAQKLTALGTTIVVSTGDYGVGGDDGDKCPNPAFIPRYPSGCPYVVSVGALEGFAPEEPMEPNNGGIGLLSSGSGASNFFHIPDYQLEKVKAYQSKIGSLQGYYNMSGRMFPDLAAQGSRYSIIFHRDTVASGTSASTPYVAALFALVNDKRKKANKGTIGWANPPLYTSALKDITVGGSYGCADTKFGFPATPGFDAATGNGSPIFAALSKAYGV